MCEFNVYIDGKIVFKDAIYVKTEGKKIMVRDVLGRSKIFEDSKITEVDVNSERLILSPNEA